MKIKIKIVLFFIILLTINCSAGSNVEHIFDLAKKSVCKDVAVDLLKNPIISNNGRPTGRGSYFISQLNKLTATPFPYRFEITNGYKEAFVYYSLLGYVNEMNGDIPIAYRYYQNSLACIDEEKSFDYPLPRAEIYLAIGRTCLAAGRYMDSKSWLDNAFLEAGDNKQLQAAIDRVGIQRANEIGDYPEVIFLYQHLLSIANDNNSPPLKGETGGCKLTKEDYANYAQILFYSRKDREGFSKLLEGISKHGIDNNLGVKDPLVDMFLNNIMRADDDEVKWFYDLLGWAIVDARAKAGDENYLAFLCNARTLFCKVYDFLNPDDDLEKVKERIDVVKEQLAAGNPPWPVTRNPLSVKRKRKRKNPGMTTLRALLRERGALREIINGEMEKTPEIVLEDLLMLADWKLKHRDYKTAGTNYYLASLIATSKFANLEYDGTTMENAAKMGMIAINPQSTINNLQLNDSSYRAAELTLQLYLAATNDKQRAQYNAESAIFSITQKSHPKVLNYLCSYASKKAKAYDFGSAIDIYNNYDKNLSILPIRSRMKLARIYSSKGSMEKVFQVLLNGLKFSQTIPEKQIYQQELQKNWSCASKRDLDDYARILLESSIIFSLGHKESNRLLYSLKWQNNLYPLELYLRKMLEEKDYYCVLSTITNLSTKYEQAGHKFNKGIALLGIGLTNSACEALIQSYLIKTKYAKKYGGHDPRCPSVELKILKKSILVLSKSNLNKYQKILATLEKKTVKMGWKNVANCLQNQIKEIKAQIYKEK